MSAFPKVEVQKADYDEGLAFARACYRHRKRLGRDRHEQSARCIDVLLTLLGDQLTEDEFADYMAEGAEPKEQVA